MSQASRHRICSTRLGPFLAAITVEIVLGWAGGTGLSYADLKVIPAITVSERYDNNIFFVQDQKTDDFVTSVSPELRAEYKGRPVTGEAFAKVSIEAFARHSDLNNAGVSGGLNLNLDQIIGRLTKRATLAISDFVSYTPELPAFFNPTPTSTPTTQAQPLTPGPTPFTVGILPQRVESLSNSSSASGSYSLTPLFSWNAGYSYSFISFGSTKGIAAESALFRTVSQSVNTGPQYKLSRFDTVNAQYVYQKSDSEGGGAAPGTRFFSNGGTLGYTRIFSPQLTANFSAGATVVSDTDRVTALASAAATWIEKSTAATLLYSRSVAPSFVVSSGPLVSDVVSLSVSQVLTQRLSGLAQVNYGRNTGASATSSLFFQSYGGNLALNYQIFRTVTGTLSYSHFRFEQEFLSVRTAFDRDLVTLSVRAEWR